MIEKYELLMLSVPFVSVIMVTMVNLLNNPIGTIEGIKNFILKVGGKEK